MRAASRAIMIALIATACAGDPAGPLDAGAWGGEGIQLNVTGTGATLQFDCGSGQIPTPIYVEEDRFGATGSVIVGQGGPIREGEQADVRDATFVGVIDGSRLTLDVTVAGTPATTTRYQLLRNAPAILRLCL